MVVYKIGESRVRHSRLSLRRRREIALSINILPEHLFHCLTITLRLPYAQPTRLKVLRILLQILQFSCQRVTFLGTTCLARAELSHLFGQVILNA